MINNLKRTDSKKIFGPVSASVPGQASFRDLWIMMTGIPPNSSRVCIVWNVPVFLTKLSLQLILKKLLLKNFRNFDYRFDDFDDEQPFILSTLISTNIKLIFENPQTSQCFVDHSVQFRKVLY